MGTALNEYFLLPVTCEDLGTIVALDSIYICTLSAVFLQLVFMY